MYSATCAPTARRLGLAFSAPIAAPIMAGSVNYTGTRRFFDEHADLIPLSHHLWLGALMRAMRNGHKPSSADCLRLAAIRRGVGGAP